MSNIFNIEQEYLELINELEMLEGELTPELEKRLAINQQELEQKVKAYHHVITILKGDSNIIDDEIERLKTLKASKQTTIDRLRKVLLDVTLMFGETGKTGNKKLAFNTLSMWTVNRDSVNIDELKFFAAPNANINVIDYKIKDKFNLTVLDEIQSIAGALETEASANKDAIKLAINSGETVIGAELVTKPSLTIR
jgi:aspartate carbamoyltransferase regulatory subunit